jgi:hypothetical protein
MAKSARASTNKANNLRLKKNVFGPVEAARAQRLSARLQALAAEPKPLRDVEMNEGVSFFLGNSFANTGTNMFLQSPQRKPRKLLLRRWTVSFSQEDMMTRQLTPCSSHGGRWRKDSQEAQEEGGEAERQEVVHRLSHEGPQEE